MLKLHCSHTKKKNQSRVLQLWAKRRNKLKCTSPGLLQTHWKKHIDATTIGRNCCWRILLKKNFCRSCGTKLILQSSCKSNCNVKNWFTIVIGVNQCKKEWLETYRLSMTTQFWPFDNLHWFLQSSRSTCTWKLNYRQYWNPDFQMMRIIFSEPRLDLNAQFLQIQANYHWSQIAVVDMVKEAEETQGMLISTCLEEQSMHQPPQP